MCSHLSLEPQLGKLSHTHFLSLCQPGPPHPESLQPHPFVYPGLQLGLPSSVPVTFLQKSPVCKQAVVGVGKSPAESRPHSFTTTFAT